MGACRTPKGQTPVEIFGPTPDHACGTIEGKKRARHVRTKIGQLSADLSQSLSPVQQIVLADSGKSRASPVGISLIPHLAFSHSYKVSGYQQIPSAAHKSIAPSPIILLTFDNSIETPWAV